MKLKNKFMPAMLFLGVVALSSCEKNEQEAMKPTFAEQGQISHVMMDSSEVTSYNFAGSRLSQINHYDKNTGKLESFEKFERDAKGKITRATTHAGDTHAKLSEQVYTYNDKGLLSETSTDYYSGGSVDYTAHATYAYNADKKLEKKSVFEGTGENAKAKSYTTYAVLPNGDYSQEEQYVVDDKGNSKLYSTTTYSYDSNSNPFYGFADPGQISSPNNMTAAKTEVIGSKKTYKYTYAYAYDERGLPVSQTVTSPNGKSEKYTYLYSN